ncbi:acyltransferase family protein [Pseudomonas sp. NPDC089918]|uniref:acyltransferase family protein n=1 Tax=Pseudomonas sp. NPDC089918 TaxID=3390654 RepID=UPI003D00FDF3
MLIGIHYMRGLAALMVVIFHAISFMVIYKNYNSPFAHHILATGVDIFFVISGFLMVKTTEKYKGSRLDWKSFLYKRLVRITPMYWTITILIALAIMYKPSLSEKTIDVDFLIKSLLFLPTKIPNSDVQSTIIPVGWTLVYEMFFYMVFAAFTAINYRKGLAAIILMFCMLSLAHSQFDNYYLTLYTNPIILEFCLGMIIAKLSTPSSKHALLLMGLGFLALTTGAYFDGPHFNTRFLSAGFGAALIIYGASGLKLKKTLVIPKLLGDSSYTTYLIHMYVIKAGAKFLPPSFVSCLILAAFSIAVGHIVYLLIESPIQKTIFNFKNRSRPELQVRT